MHSAIRLNYTTMNFWKLKSKLSKARLQFFWIFSISALKLITEDLDLYSRASKWGVGGSDHKAPPEVINFNHSEYNRFGLQFGEQFDKNLLITSVFFVSNLWYIDVIWKCLFFSGQQSTGYSQVLIVTKFDLFMRSMFEICMQYKCDFISSLHAYNTDKIKNIHPRVFTMIHKQESPAACTQEAIARR